VYGEWRKICPHLSIDAFNGDRYQGQRPNHTTWYRHRSVGEAWVEGKVGDIRISELGIAGESTCVHYRYTIAFTCQHHIRFLLKEHHEHYSVVPQVTLSIS
jgi:hypothetical protein